uniref:Uncharacterized protein n=1 Tax=Triticum urartu TaxID=4572 RepID=A0A8R7P264_TRIUA
MCRLDLGRLLLVVACKQSRCGGRCLLGSTVVSDDPSKEATESSDYFLVVCRELSTTARHLEKTKSAPCRYAS